MAAAKYTIDLENGPDTPDVGGTVGATLKANNNSKPKLSAASLLSPPPLPPPPPIHAVMNDDNNKPDDDQPLSGKTNAHMKGVVAVGSNDNNNNFSGFKKMKTTTTQDLEDETVDDDYLKHNNSECAMQFAQTVYVASTLGLLFTFVGLLVTKDFSEAPYLLVSTFYRDPQTQQATARDITKYRWSIAVVVWLPLAVFVRGINMWLYRESKESIHIRNGLSTLLFRAGWFERFLLFLPISITLFNSAAETDFIKIICVVGYILIAEILKFGSEYFMSANDLKRLVALSLNLAAAIPFIMYWTVLLNSTRNNANREFASSANAAVALYFLFDLFQWLWIFTRIPKSSTLRRHVYAYYTVAHILNFFGLLALSIPQLVL